MSKTESIKPEPTEENPFGINPEEPEGPSISETVANVAIEAATIAVEAGLLEVAVEVAANIIVAAIEGMSDGA